MSGKQDKKQPSNNHDVDFSVIRTAIQIGGKSIEQILNGVYYGSAEVRHLLMNECDFILECKVCHNLFRSLPNFVAHKRVYCVEFYEEHKFNLLQKEKEGETIIVQPQPPPPSPPQKPNEAESVMTINKTTFRKNETNVVSSVMDEVLSGKFKGKSQAYNLYTQLAEKVEQQKETRMVKQVTLSPIPSTSCAMRLDMKEVEVAFVEDKIETDQAGTGSSGSQLETKRSHIQRLCEKLAASTGSKIAGEESHVDIPENSNPNPNGNQNFEPPLTKRKVYETRTRSNTPENHSNNTCTESPSKNHNLEDSPTKRKTREGRTSRDTPGIPMAVISSIYTEIHSGNESLAAASTRSRARESRTRTPDSAVVMKISTSTKDQDANQSLEASAAKKKINMARTKKDTFNDDKSGTDNQSSDISPTKRKVSVARTRRDTPDSPADVNSTENPSENLSSSSSSKRKVLEDRQDHPDSLVDVNSTVTVNQSRNQSLSKKQTNETRIRKETPDSLDVRSSKRIEEKDTVSLRKSDPQKVYCIPTSTTSVASSRSLPESNDVGVKSPFRSLPGSNDVGVKSLVRSLPESNDVGTMSPFRPGNVILKGEEEPNSVSITTEGNMTYSEARNDQRQMNFWQKYCDFEFLTCRLCSAKCTDSMALKLHAQEKHNIKFINLQCPICYKAFFAKNLITRHLRRTHKKSSYQTSNLLRQVPGIETRGSDISEFNVDMSSVPEGACPLCNKSFITPHKLTRHMVRFHDKSRGAVRHLLDHAGVLYPTCSLCSKTVLSEYSLERHLERTHGKTREAAKKMLKIDKLKNKLLKEAGTSTPSSSPNLFIQNTDTQVKKQPSPSKRSTDKGRGEEHSDVLIRLCPGCKREFWKFKTFIRHWPFCARKHNLNRYKDLPQAKALRRGNKRTLSFVNSTMSSEMITDSGEKGLLSGEQNEDTSIKQTETEWTRSSTAERENRSIPNKVSLVPSRQSISPYSNCSVSNSSSSNRDQASTVSVDVESMPPRPQSCSASSSSSHNRDRASDVSTATEPAHSDAPAKPIGSDRSKIVRMESEAKGGSFKPFITVTSGIGWRTCAGCKCVFAKARTYQKHIRNCKLIKVKRSSKKTTFRQKVKNDSCWKSRADDNTEREVAERSEKPNNSVGLSSVRKSLSHPESSTPVSGGRDVVQASTSGETNFDETDGMSVIQENFEEVSASEDEDWNTTAQSFNSGNTVHTVEEIWVGKQPGRPVEKIKSNRIYVVDQSRTHKSLCQDQKKINACIDDSNLRCLQCGMEFSHISNVRRHVIRHLGWKRYKCRMCRFSSYNLSECRMHLYRTHSMEMWHSTSSQVEKFVVNLNKEASKVRTMKKQATLRGKRAQEKYEPSPYSLKIPQNLPGQRSSFRSSQRQLVDRRKPGVNEQNIKNLNCFNISTRNVSRNFDTRPYAPVDRMSTLVTRKGYYPKSSGGSSPSSLSDSQPPATRHARNEDLEFSDHTEMILVSTALPGLDPSISQDRPAIEATSASSLPTLTASIPVENL
ncbi:hypothetical protein ACJMK2_000145 [Sinanodonta woodiana]|uniref:C2H2-type domain-containing protein n=1 Tax=Sinanodonta woodiana TaxID=1069815 RepID=A0ABD3XRR5_SINWO